MYKKETAPGKVYRIYTDVQEFIKDMPDDIPVYQDKARKFLQIGSGFDIETTLINRKSFMYHGQWSLGDQIILFRHWSDFDAVYTALLNLCRKKKACLMVWVANLGYEFSYICRRIKFTRVFAKEQRHPLSAASGKIIFRDCLAVSGQGGLENLARTYCVTKKLRGDLDYTKIRNSTTPMTPKEIDYCINDVAILSEWSDYCFSRWIIDGAGHIPMTITGICRNAVKEAAGPKIQTIKRLIHDCYPKTKEEYCYMMRWLFRGGFTHANIVHVGQVVEDVIGVDFTSSYPACMLHFSYPCSPFVRTELETDGHEITDFRLQSHAVWMILEIWNIDAKTWHTIESKHKIIAAHNDQYDNGRLICADYIRVALTEIDYDIYTMFYKWERIHVAAAFCAHKAPLPDYLIKPLMDAYQTKTRLKRSGKDKTVEYQNSKTIVNSFYGMTVTRLSFTDWTFDQTREDPWQEVKTKKPYWQMIKDQILLPQWGIWVTAYARQCLLSVVAEMDPDKSSASVLYCDTDSIYFIDTPANRAIISTWNKYCSRLNEFFPPEFDDIGCFDFIDKKARYKFKTLGAKRYLKLDDSGHTTVTVAGMRCGTYERAVSSEEPPDDAYVYVTIDHDDGTKERRYLSELDFFGNFDNMFLLSADQSCKLACIYHDHPYSAMVDGECMQELSGAALVNIPFQIRMDRLWISEVIKLQRKLRRDDIYDTTL